MTQRRISLQEKADRLVAEGIDHKNAGRLTEAESSYREALEIEPGNASALGNLGVALRLQGRVSEAISCFRRLTHACPDFPQAFFSLGNSLSDAAQWDDAVNAYRRAIAIDGGYIECRINLAVALLAQGDHPSAAVQIDEALRQDPDAGIAYRVRGDLYRSQGRLITALSSYERAQQGQRPDVLALARSADLLLALGLPAEAVPRYARALELAPSDRWLFDSYLMSLSYAGSDPVRWFEAHQYFGARFGGKALPTNATRAPHRSSDRIRLGYVSGDLSQHAVANFFWPVLQNHDRSSFEVTCYYSGKAIDRATQLFANAADRWRHVHGLQTDAVVNLVRQDDIDILIDLSTHSECNRLDVFARRAAPIQFTWMGYASTTGLSEIDYRISDLFLDPLGETERFHTERIARLDRYSLCFSPSPVCPEVAPCPYERNGFLTFGSMNNAAKLNPRTLDLWARLLHEIPDSQLAIYMGGSKDEEVAAHARQLFTSRGIDGKRVRPFDRLPFIDYLRFHDEIDIALDPLGFSGVTTSCYSLWMGVPVITLPELLPLSRGTAAIEKMLELPGFVATNEIDYVERAKAASLNPAFLSTTRQSIRDRMRCSPLLDGADFTRALEAMYRSKWQESVR